MRARLFAVASILTSAVGTLFACVGDDLPANGASTSSSSSGSSSGAASSTSSGSSSTSGSGSSSGDAPDAPADECTKLQVSTIAGGEQPGLEDTGDAGTSKLNGPEGIAAADNGVLWVADTKNAVLRRVTPSGVTTTFVTTKDDPDISPANGFFVPTRVRPYFAEAFVVDYTDDAIRKVTADGKVSNATTFGALRAFATLKWFVTNQDCGIHDVITKNIVIGDAACGFIDGDATAARFGAVQDFAFDADGNAYVTDATNFAIRKIKPDKSVETVTIKPDGTNDASANKAEFDEPSALTIDPVRKHLYVTDKTRIRKVDLGTGAVTTLVGAGAAFADGDGCSARFLDLKGITYFGSALYVTDLNRVRKITLPTD